jgi:PAS domain S-box-containing protein
MSLHHVTPGDDRSSRQAVYEAFADRGRPFEDATECALSVGLQRLGVELGFLTEISEGRQTISIVQTAGTDRLLEPGESCPLDQAYCRRTVELDSPLCVQDAVRSDDVSELAYETFGLGTYVGAKVTVDGETYGTVCFADREPRAEPFPESDQLFVELVARLVGQAIERRRYERTLEARNEALRAQTERAERIADTTFDLLYEIDPTGELTYVSSGVETILGYAPAEVAGMSFLDFIAPASQADATAAFERVADGDAISGIELEATTNDGETVVIEVNSTPVFEDGDVVAHQGVARDVTERHEREAELRVKNRAIDSASLGIVISDATKPDNPISYANDAFEKLTGYPSEAILGRNCRLLQGPQTDEESVAVLREAVAAGEPASVELVNYRRDGAPFWNKVRIVPVEDDTGTLTQFVGFQEDVTDKNRTSRLISLLNRVLRHNLRNELNIVQGHGRLLQETEMADDSARSLEVIDETVQGLLSLSDTVRELERIARQDRDPVRLDVPTLFAEAVSGPRAAFPDATVTTRIDLPDDRSLCAGVELTRAVEELVTNALEHDSSPPTVVDVTARSVGDEVEIVVTDDGPGIPSVEASVIEAGHETDVEHGNGLGLWLVNWIVTRYGGSFQIHAASPADDATGTVATISLPGLGPTDDPQAVVRPHTTLFQ